MREIASGLTIASYFLVSSIRSSITKVWSWWSSLCPTFSAVYRSASVGFEGNFAFLSTVGTDCLEHFARRHTNFHSPYFLTARTKLSFEKLLILAWKESWDRLPIKLAHPQLLQSRELLFGLKIKEFFGSGSGIDVFLAAISFRTQFWASMFRARVSETSQATKLPC